MSGQPQPQPAPEPAAQPPVLRVERGEPTDEELAAVVAVLLAGLSGGDAEPPAGRPRWGAPGRSLGSSYGPVRGGWRASGLPR